HRPLAAAFARRTAARARRQRPRAAPPPQSLLALSRPGELARAARSVAPDGARRPDRRRQAPARANVAAGDAPAAREQTPATWRRAHPAHRLAARAAQEAARTVTGFRTLDFGLRPDQPRSPKPGARSPIMR